MSILKKTPQIGHLLCVRVRVLSTVSVGVIVLCPINMLAMSEIESAVEFR